MSTPYCCAVAYRICFSLCSTVTDKNFAAVLWAPDDVIRQVEYGTSVLGVAAVFWLHQKPPADIYLSQFGQFQVVVRLTCRLGRRQSAACFVIDPKTRSECRRPRPSEAPSNGVRYTALAGQQRNGFSRPRTTCIYEP